VSGRRSVQRGIALMLVLWVLALLTIIAVGLTATQRTESTLAGNQLATARFRAVAEAAVSWAILNLLAPPSTFDEDVDEWVPDGSARPWIFAGETLEIKVFNEASRIDLNTAGRDLLENMFTAVELPRDEASALADAIEDWRDDNDTTELNGAEDGDYEDAGRSYGAKDGPFESVDELQLVLGVDRDLYRRVLPALTVDSGGGKLEQTFASPLVLAAVRGTTLAEVELALEEREGRSDAIDLDSVGRGGPVYRIRVTRMEKDKPGLTMETLVRVEAGGAKPVTILWRRFGLVADRS
jgi:general secretion pathway protein K